MTIVRDSWRVEIIADGTAEAEDLRQWRGVELRDLLPGMARELKKLVPKLPRSVLEERANWVVYPWRNVALRVLGPNSFRLLRLDRNRNKITYMEQEAFAAKTIAVIGLSVGNVTAHLLALEGLCGGLRLGDHDTIELSNLNRIPGSLFDIGVNKALVAYRRIAELDPYLRVEIEPDGVTAESMGRFLDGVDLLIEECDSLDVKVLAREQARRRQIPVLMETSDRGLLDVERFDLEPDRPVFHGLLGATRTADLAGLAAIDKVPYTMQIIEADKMSARLAASMVEIGASTTTWPQLGSDVYLGAALIARCVYQWGVGGSLPSGRTRVDTDDILASLKTPVPISSPAARPLTRRAPLAESFETALLQAASFAPSGGNTQPWTFALEENALIIGTSDTRRSRFDIGGRGELIAAGAAMLNARAVAASAHALGPVEEIIDVDRPERALALTIGDQSDEPLAELATAILERVTNRRLTPGAHLTEPELKQLQHEVQQEQCDLTWVSQRDLGPICDWWAEADRVRFITPELHADLMSELRDPARDDLSWGIDERTLEFEPADQAKLPILRRNDVMSLLNTWDAGTRLGDDIRKRLNGSAGMLIVTAPHQSRSGLLAGGAALQRMWLRAELLGLGLQPVTPIFLLARNQQELEPLVGLSRAATLYGYGQELRSFIGAMEDCQLISTLRVTRGRRPTAISERETPQVIYARG